MRLKDDDRTPTAGTILRSGKSGEDLRRMMTVVVDHRNPILLTFELEPSIRILEFCKRLGDLLERDLQLKRYCGRRESVINVVLSGNRQSDVAKYVVASPNGERRAEAFVVTNVMSRYIR